jgi:hypothetical protein
MTSQQIREFVALVRTDTPADCTQWQLTVTCDGYDANEVSDGCRKRAHDDTKTI